MQIPILVSLLLLPLILRISSIRLKVEESAGEAAEGGNVAQVTSFSSTGEKGKSYRHTYINHFCPYYTSIYNPNLLFAYYMSGTVLGALDVCI